eukprot:jgi/Botrbrau1/23095/Bobra.0243s0032.2
MKQGSWGWVQRVLRGASKRSQGNSTSECTCPGRRDVASAASVSRVEACDRPTSVLHHTTASQGREAILNAWQYGTRGPQGGLTTWVVVFAAGTAAGTLMAGSANALDKLSIDDFVAWGGRVPRPWLPESWNRRSAPGMFLGSRPANMQGSLTPNFIADAAAQAAPSVVNISVHGNGLPVQNGKFEAGSGFIISPDGMIVTNAHVLRDALEGQTKGSFPIMVSLQDERVFEAHVLRCDRVSDLAILKIEAKEPLPCAKLGTSSRLRVGEWVLAMGSPLHLQNSVTAGIVSCVDRKAVDLGLAKAQTDYIQTDAAVNSGNSGGPLVNLCGEVVGISSLKAVSADGVSFAIPVDAAKEIIDQVSFQVTLYFCHCSFEIVCIDFPSDTCHVEIWGMAV